MGNSIETTYENGREFSHEDQAREYLRVAKERIAYETMNSGQFTSKEDLENMKKRLETIKQLEAEYAPQEEQNTNDGPRMVA